jgi:hypothetical protein
MVPLKILSHRRIRLFDLTIRNPHSTMNTTRWMSSTMYYDSQSGLHIPVHNETEIKLFLNINQEQRDGRHMTSPSFVPHQLYKNHDESVDVAHKLEAMTRQGIYGMILPPIQFPRDVRNLKTLTSIAPPSFTFLYSYAGQDLVPHFADMASLTRNDDQTVSTLSMILEHANNDNGDHHGRTQIHASLKEAREHGLHTTLSISETVYACDDFKPITLANAVGTLIDTVKGCDLIWLSSPSKNNDAIVTICEELIYLDVAGPTIKSRLLVDSVEVGILEDVMFAGVNKFVINDESQIEMIENVAIEQGKYIAR